MWTHTRAPPARETTLKPGGRLTRVPAGTNPTTGPFVRYPLLLLFNLASVVAPVCQQTFTAWEVVVRTWVGGWADPTACRRSWNSELICLVELGFHVSKLGDFVRGLAWVSSFCSGCLWFWFSVCTAGLYTVLKVVSLNGALRKSGCTFRAPLCLRSLAWKKKGLLCLFGLSLEPVPCALQFCLLHLVFPLASDCCHVHYLFDEAV